MAENTFDRFSVFFTKDTVFLDGAAFPLGQLTTDVLNLDGEILTEIDQRVNGFMSAAPGKNRQRRLFRTGTAQRCLGFNFRFAGLSEPASGHRDSPEFIPRPSV